MTTHVAYASTATEFNLLAGRYAAREQEEAEAEIDALVRGAIKAWLIAEATMWHRVKFRSRRMRAAARSRAGNRTATSAHDR